jgi:hypothetical protein
LAKEGRDFAFMIPKIIHYCWFSGNKMSQDEVRYIEGWKDILRGYEFKLWNEDTFDVHSIKFTKQAAKARKWAFISDYVHAYAVYHYGGISLDTDVEILRPFDDLLNANSCFGGFEDETYINPGSIFAGEKGCSIAQELMDFYAAYNITNKDESFNLVLSPQVLTKILLKHGLQQDNSYQDLGCMTVYPAEYFCPKSFRTGILNVTDNTYSIHHYKGSWLSKNDTEEIKRKQNVFFKYGDNELSNKLIELTTENIALRDNDINTMPLLNVYRTAAKRTVKKILGKRVIDAIKKIVHSSLKPVLF